MMRRGRGSGLGIGEVAGENGAGSCGSYRQIVRGLMKRGAQT